ncbi:MAG TPA: glycoside hydrolase family 172 protein [Armatimonadota bacterium]|jgi:hypothetical protein
MSRVHRLFLAAALLPLACLAAHAQSPMDGLELARLKPYTAERSSSNNADLSSNDDSKRLPAGQTLTLADVDGPGAITHIWMTLAANEYAWPRLLRLRIYWDNSPFPSVDTPLGDFFAVGHGYERKVDSLPVRCSSDGRSHNCYWPMPFRKHARVTMTNEGKRGVGLFYFHVDWRKQDSIPYDVAYFHAHYRQAIPAPPGRNYVIADIQGTGHYVGTVLSVVQNRTGWFGEGDDMWYVDGETTASLQGTGTEDFFNDAWGFHEATGPYYGITVADGQGVGARSSAYRWQILDPVPFKKSLRLEIEHKGWTFNDETDGSVRSGFEERADEFSSVAFWYQKELKPLPDLPAGYARTPYGNATVIEAEDLLSKVKTEKGEAEIQKGLDWTKDLIFFKGVGVGSSLSIPFNAPTDGAYEITTQLVHSYDYGTYQASLDGKPLGEPQKAYAAGTYASLDHILGRAKLAAGPHELTFKAVGKEPASTGYYLGVDNIVLAKLP